MLTGFKTDTTHIVNSFELVFHDGVLDHIYLEEKIRQFSTIYPDEFVVGAYLINTVGLDIDSTLAGLLKGLLKDSNTEPKFLVFNPSLATQKFSNVKFIKVYDTELNELKYDIVSKDAEKISVDTILNLKDGVELNNQAKLKQQVELQKFTLASIERKVNVLKRYLESKPEDQAVLRNINALISKLLNFKATQDIKTQLVDLENDFNLLLTLGSVNENLSTLTRVSNELKRQGHMHSEYEL